MVLKAYYYHDVDISGDIPPAGTRCPCTEAVSLPSPTTSTVDLNIDHGVRHLGADNVWDWWPTAGSFPNDSTPENDHRFSVIWKGYIDMRDYGSGTYDFRLESDDGSCLRIGPPYEFHLSCRGEHPPSGTPFSPVTDIIEIRRDALCPSIDVYFGQNGRGASGIELSWRPPNADFEIVPEAVLRKGPCCWDPLSWMKQSPRATTMGTFYPSSPLRRRRQAC